MKRNPKIFILVSLAMLTAILFLLSLTPLGYLKIGVIEITLMMIPVAIGAMTLGVGVGAFLGAVFGFSSFLTCLGLLNPSSFGMLLFSISPVGTALTCIVPRLLMGTLCGLLYRFLHTHFGDKTWVYAVTSASSALLNTVFYMSALVLFFHDMMTGNAASEGKSIFLYVIGVSLVNCLSETAVATLVGTPVAKAVCRFLKK